MQTYHVSIIDFLQLWNFGKKSEQFAKVHILRANKTNLSAVEPEFYKNRFQRFMRRQVFINTKLYMNYLGGSFMSRKNSSLIRLERSTD